MFKLASDLVGYSFRCGWTAPKSGAMVEAEATSLLGVGLSTGRGVWEPQWDCTSVSSSSPGLSGLNVSDPRSSMALGCQPLGQDAGIV